MSSKVILLFLFLVGFLLITFLVATGVFLQTDQYIDQTLAISTTSIFYYVSKIMAYIYLPLLVVIFTLSWRFMRKKQR